MSNLGAGTTAVSPNSETSSPDRRKLRKNVILGFLSLSTFMIFHDGTVVNTALPAIARDFGANNSVLQWVVNMYSLILAGLLLVGGSLGDRFGRRNALAGGMVVFGLGAVGAALAEDSTTLVVMRGVQGLGVPPIEVVYM
jgi:MFS family permease